MFIKGFECGPLYTLAYLVSDGRMGEDGFATACVIDCSYGSTPLILSEAQRRGFRIQKILNTHGHFDHTADNYPLQQATQAPIYIHPSDEWRLKEPYKEPFPIPFSIIPTEASAHLHDGDRITVGTLQFEVIYTPGHTLGGVCLYEPTHKVLFSGDTLFRDSVGRWDFIDGNLEQLVQSLERLLRLPADTKVYPGHGEPTTIGRERQLNPFVRQLVPSFH
ncbi:MAG: MBL fold metallo-hydrolase [Chloroherpetonaceae bacterium]|nr:MBL fold metallo-hydrolase [Chloroherpetonaceae bacterium]MCS7211930.1 MBL fold metallo-hydrolase [Chloroherpetonaceae bacterium]MDW8020354.1 MBL fold metallo-hydrolase [Chloroherpetonaceae bacterium]MDW8466781.1 MBL fold metallo-hydrolase [Chloroherpetonaceae bacterium]